ncbi:DUF4811 domain-containing protein [Lactiplantibacillus nangangensis]|uniref:DUF4811 domain-containing protein n=1 Tax=Lactiplantibacillus nangangensis TaxID=2559917 RepID=A0ABW1SFR8_9LACO|nr:DUF4811 domain-containing protein [Lactiplantibacillus nangangensis]
MLIIIMLIAGFTAGWLLITRHRLWGIVAVVVMLGCQGLLLLDTVAHFGTSLTTQTVTTKIAPVASIKGNQLLVTKQLKQGKTSYTAYATRQPRTRKTQLILNHQKRVRIVTGVRDDQVAKVTQNRCYVYRQAWLKWLFSGVTAENQRQQQTVTYRLSSTWHVLTKAQLTTLSRRLKQPAVQAQLQQTVKQQVATKLKAQPQLASQKATLVKQAEQTAISTVIKQVQNGQN